MVDVYTEPLVGRYTDRAMQELFSDTYKFTTWRKCWIALAQAQNELGLKQVTSEMIAEMQAAQNTIDFAVAQKKEQEIRHDVMAHVYEFGTHCPKAKGIIHLGATSMFVCDNTELIQMREGLKLLRKDLLMVLANLHDFAQANKDLVTLGYTHYQPAQPTTIGKRATLYLQDLLLDLKEFDHVAELILARGAKGTVGTQASYLELFGSYEKVQQLDKLVSEKLGFTDAFPVTGQTYTRKLDTLIVKMLAGIGESAHKFAVDLRLFSNLKILEEPFEENQTGSSAMAYKRNPMRSERMTALARKLINLQVDFSHTSANQWAERSLDDSALRRMNIPQAFLLTNAILKLYVNITSGMVVYPAQIRKHLDAELPFMATEVMLMDLSAKGHDRQELHEIIKEHSVAAAKAVKQEGKANDLFERLAKDEAFPMNAQELQALLDKPERFAGAAARQTEEFLAKHVAPIIKDVKRENSQISV